MPLEGSYAVWNNRGGSGKTNLTYHLAIKYAYRNPDKTVLVVDMCPQADLSHAFLGKKILAKTKYLRHIEFVYSLN
jgi:cellulose biosynthesis protein BcsQ